MTAILTGGCDAVAHAVESVATLQPYLPGKPISELEREYGIDNIIKLASNENPLGASPRAVEAMQAGLGEMALYPDGGGFALRTALGEKHGVDADCVTLGNGSNDVLVLLAETFLQPGTEAVFSQYCFAVYPIATHAAGATPREAPALPAGHEQALGHDLAAMRALVNERTRIVFVANPNNPTGNWLEPDELEGFIADLPSDVLVVVDEAYHEYALALGLGDASQWLGRYPNLVVCRTFSKAYGLAGIRVGYCLSSPEVAGLLNRLRQPFNVNALAMSGAESALADQAFIDASVRCNTEGLAQVGAAMERLGLGYTPSAANFLLVDLGRLAGPVYEALLRGGVIVRPVGNYGLPNHLRITIGTADENARLIETLSEHLKSP